MHSKSLTLTTVRPSQLTSCCSSWRTWEWWPQRRRWKKCSQKLTKMVCYCKSCSIVWFNGAKHVNLYLKIYENWRWQYYWGKTFFWISIYGWLLRRLSDVPPAYSKLRVLLFGMSRIRISDPGSLGSWCIKGTDESTLNKDPSVLLMHHDASDLGSLILNWIIPKEHTLSNYPCYAQIRHNYP